MDRKELLPKLIGCILVTLLFVACGTSQPTPTPTSFPATNTPAPTSTLPTTHTGIAQ